MPRLKSVPLPAAFALVCVAIMFMAGAAEAAPAPRLQSKSSPEQRRTLTPGSRSRLWPRLPMILITRGSPGHSRDRVVPGGLRHAYDGDTEQRGVYSAYRHLGDVGRVTAGSFRCEQECDGDGNDQCGARADVWDGHAAERGERRALQFSDSGDGWSCAADGDFGFRHPSRRTDGEFVRSNRWTGRLERTRRMCSRCKWPTTGIHQSK